MTPLSRQVSPATQPAALERLLQSQTAAHPGQSGAHLLSDGLDAFLIRTASARIAAHSIDLQYYIWRNDATGRFLAQELLRAADRGVHVRLLLDDMDARPRDDVLMALDRHKRIEIRLFNPFRTRRGLLRTARELFVRASRLNHRMHNKAWIADRRLAIVGGRNIGDEYFAASDSMNFIDTDVAIVGPAVDEALHIFDAYWNSEVVKRIARLRRLRRPSLTLPAVRARLEEASLAWPDSPYAQRVREELQPELLIESLCEFVWSDVEIVADDPRKALRRPHGPGVLESIVEAIETARSEVLLISSYFVPGEGGAAALSDLARRVKVAVLTNSLAATDVAAVHSGYSRYRAALLQAGVRLYELKSSVAAPDEERRMHIGSSRASLHTKAAIVDGDRIFVGSFNLDPRSAELNCEMGAWIRSEALARRLRATFDTATAPGKSFSVTLDEQGRPRWSEVVGGRTVEHRRDPYAGWPRRALTWLLGLLPLESQL